MILVIVVLSSILIFILKFCVCCRQAGLDVDEQLSWSCLGPVLPIPIVFDVMKYSDIGVPGLIAAGYDLTRFASSTIRFRLTLPPGMACEEAYEWRGEIHDADVGGRPLQASYTSSACRCRQVHQFTPWRVFSAAVLALDFVPLL